MPWGVYIGLPPRGTMVIQLGAGPSRLCLCPPASSPTGGARRLVVPAGCWSFGRQAGPTARGLCRGLVTVAPPLVARASSWKAWLQCRRREACHCSLTSSYLLNGAPPSREWTGRLLGIGRTPGRPRFEGGRFHYSHTPSHRRYVGADFEGTIWAAC